MARLGDFVKIHTGKLDANASSPNGKYPFFTCAVEPLKIDSYSYDCECVLLAGNGDLNVKYYNGKFDAYQRTYVIESFDKGKLLVPYLYYFMERYVETLRRESIGGVIKYIKLGNITEAKINVPDLDSQTAVIERLRKLDKLFQFRKQQLAKLDELVKAQFIACFMIGGKYPVIPIGELVDKNIGRKNALFGKYDTIRYIDISSIDNRQRKITGFVEYPINDAPSRAQQLLKQDDILVSTVRPNLQNIARNPYSDGNVIASTGFCVLRCSKCLPEYLWGVVSSEKFTSTMSKQAKGANYPAVGNNDILQYLVPNVPLSKQERFAAFVRQSEKSKLAIREGLNKMETLKQALMQTYFG